jgi:hypothetical protein
LLLFWFVVSRVLITALSRPTEAVPTEAVPDESIRKAEEV